jgi:ArsR family transcriptional regulator
MIHSIGTVSFLFLLGKAVYPCRADIATYAFVPPPQALNQRPNMTQTDWDTADHAAAVLKRLANPMRLRLLLALRGGPQSVSVLQVMVGATQPAVSLQLLRMRNDGLVSCYRDADDARIMLYAVAEPRTLALLDMAATI